jgi:hypothetical protein
MARPKKLPLKLRKPSERRGVRLYVLDVVLMSGPIEEEFVKLNPSISRTIEIRGDQTLGDLHQAIYDAFDRWDDHLYEFQFGKQPMDPKAKIYGLGSDFGASFGPEGPSAAKLYKIRIDSLALMVRSNFFYWFDFGDDWWHEITVEDIKDEIPDGTYPKVSRRVGVSPPQYPNQDDDDDFDDEDDDDFDDDDEVLETE